LLSASSDKPFSGHAGDVLLAGLSAVGKTLVPYNEHHAGVDLLAHLVSVCSDRPHSAVRCTDHSESRSGHASFLVVGLRSDCGQELLLMMSLSRRSGFGVTLALIKVEAKLHPELQTLEGALMVRYSIGLRLFAWS